MLHVYPVILEALRALRPSIATIERRDADLARQLRRAAASVALNTAEGMGSRGKNRGARYATALGSARETVAALEVAEALGYIESLHPGVRAQLDRIVGTLVRLAR